MHIVYVKPRNAHVEMKTSARPIMQSHDGGAADNNELLGGI